MKGKMIILVIQKSTDVEPGSPVQHLHFYTL